MFVVWMIEIVSYGYEEVIADEWWWLFFNDTPEFNDIKPYVKCETLDEIEHVSIVMLELFLIVVPDFVIHNFWQSEQQPYLHSLRTE